jgi:hypothetical protein
MCKDGGLGKACSSFRTCATRRGAFTLEGKGAVGARFMRRRDILATAPAGWVGHMGRGSGGTPGSFL